MLSRLWKFVSRNEGRSARSKGDTSEQVQSLITVEDVRRANERLMRGIKDEGPDVYERNGLKRPTRQEIEEAGARAMRKMRERGELSDPLWLPENEKDQK